MAALTVIERCSVCCRYKFTVFNRNPPLLTACSFFLSNSKQQLRWNRTHNYLFKCTIKNTRNDGSVFTNVTLSYFSDVAEEPVLDSTTDGDGKLCSF